MALEIRQQLKLSQQLVMTPQLQQAIKLLQLSRMELVEMVRDELEKNPLLEEGSEEGDDKEPLREEQEDVRDEDSQQEEFIDPAEGRDRLKEIDWQTYFGDYSFESSHGEGNEGGEGDEERPYYENVLAKKTSLADHLRWQVGLSSIDDLERKIAFEIIGNLDDDGYLKSTLDEIAGVTGSSLEQAEKVLGLVQELDPPGVASRDLQECLLRQLESLQITNPLAEGILRFHLKALENRKYHVIAKNLDVSLEEILAAAKIIASLEPRPGRPFFQEDTHYIIPDIFVYKVGDDYVVVLNDDGLPSLRVSSFYRNALSGGKDTDEEIGEYVREKMRSALWLIKSIHQRQRTIYKVTRSIVKFQREFFDKGIEHLKPLVLRDVAEDIQMHESTISRVTTNKYVQTPRGLFELKYFFNSGINTSGGESIASESVKNKIEEIIASEDVRKPYSDQKIVELLKKEGIEIARRTVTKYREMLNIGSSTDRKRYF
ncbi:MAG: RNA polymerase factor sigma-54 [Deltaproteobacteria bacterium]|nr:RNA polymerase factor sigma-54 [Deltaproteobacteria bacterium]